jgi:hypothetical protein
MLLPPRCDVRGRTTIPPPILIALVALSGCAYTQLRPPIPPVTPSARSDMYQSEPAERRDGREEAEAPFTALTEEQIDSLVLEELHADIIALAGVPYCDGDGDCRIARLSYSPCGEEYLIYSLVYTDPAVLDARIRNYHSHYRYVANKWGWELPWCLDPKEALPRVVCREGVCGEPPPSDIRRYW